jgi:MFS family permease
MSNGIGSPIQPPAPRLTRTQWLILVIASIGFAFDIYELLMLPLIIRPALLELLGISPGTPEFASAVAKLFYIPAVAGGVFGLFGGYLTDLLGRRRVLTWSILLYAFSAFFAGFSTSFEMLLFFRCTTFIGVCVEFVAAVAWLAELFPNPHQREKVLGYTQAFSSIGGLMVAGAYALAVKFGEQQQLLPSIHMPGFLSSLGTINNEHAAWRYTLMSGLIPAIPLIIIRPFLPESPAWAAKKAAGTLKRPSFTELFQPAYRKTTVVTMLLFACSYGAAFGAIQQIPQIVPGLPEVQAKVKAETDKLKAEAASKGAEPDKKALARTAGIVNQSEAAKVTFYQEIGGLFGRVLLAVLVVYFVSRRALLRVFLIPGLFIMPLVFGYAATTDLMLLQIGIFLAGVLTVGQFSFWGNYLPTVYPLHLRGTGESVAANIGGRLIGTSFAAITSLLATQSFMPGGTPQTKLAYTAAIVGGFVYLSALIISTWLPEPDPKMEE